MAPYSMDLRTRVLADCDGGLAAKDVADQLGEQAWELARIASRKFERTRYAYWLVLAFLSAWAVARSALAVA